MFMFNWQSPQAAVIIMTFVHQEQRHKVRLHYYKATKSTEGEARVDGLVNGS